MTKDLHFDLYKGFFKGKKMVKFIKFWKKEIFKSPIFYDKLHFVAKNIKRFFFSSTFISSSQIWLNHLMDGCHYSYITMDCHFDLYKGFFIEKTNPNSPNFEDNNFKSSYFYDKLQ
jgi:hypothetical protein